MACDRQRSAGGRPGAVLRGARSRPGPRRRQDTAWGPEAQLTAAGRKCRKTVGSRGVRRDGWGLRKAEGAQGGCSVPGRRARARPTSALPRDPLLPSGVWNCPTTLPPVWGLPDPGSTRSSPWGRGPRAPSLLAPAWRGAGGRPAARGAGAGVTLAATATARDPHVGVRQQGRTRRDTAGRQVPDEATAWGPGHRSAHTPAGAPRPDSLRTTQGTPGAPLPRGSPGCPHWP